MLSEGLEAKRPRVPRMLPGSPANLLIRCEKRERFQTYGFASRRSVAHVAKAHRKSTPAKNTRLCAVTLPKTWIPEGLTTFTRNPAIKDSRPSHQDKLPTNL